MSTVRPATVREVADRLGIRPNTVKRIPTNELPYFRIGTRGDRRYEESHIARYKRERIND